MIKERETIARSRGCLEGSSGPGTYLHRKEDGHPGFPLIKLKVVPCALQELCALIFSTH